MQRWIALAAISLVAIPSLAAADANAPVTVTDAKGAQHRIPADRTTLLLFLRPDQDQSRQAVDAAKAVLADSPPCQVLAILSGTDAVPQASKLGALPWPLIADPNFELVGRFRVRVWPTSLVVPSDGGEVARVAGLPQAYTRDLSAYLAFAGGKIDRKTLQERLGASEAITDSPHQMALRHLRVAQRLLEKGMAEQARQEVERGLQLKPSEPELLLCKARALLLLRQSEDALAILAALPKTSIPSAKINTMKGSALTALLRWDQAIEVLQEAVKLNPEPAEAQYLLGLAYQAKGRLADAAAAFRTAFEATDTGRLLMKTPAPPPPTTIPAGK